MLNFTPARVLRSGLFCALSALAVMPANSASVFVPAGGNLQGALNQAQGGDTITLAAGATFTGHFTLAPNNSGKWITIQSSAMSSLPASGQRVTPTQAPSMAKLVTPDPNPLFTIPSGANNYRIQGIEFTVVPGLYANDLIVAGTGGETAVSQLPQNIDFDRDYIHGDPVSGGKRGIALNNVNTTVENSYFADFTSTWQDTQALAGWNGPGPFLIQNNHLEAGTEIVAFGGAVPSISGLVPSNITIQNNEFFKPTRYFAGSADYAGVKVWAKNHIEFKNGQSVTIQNNTFTNNFKQADQLGCTILLNVRDEGGQVPWATVSHITVQNNRFQHVAGGVLLMGHDSDGGGTAGDLHFSNNLWTNMGEFGGDGRMYEILNGVNGLTIDHDTAFPTGWLMVFDLGASYNIQVTNSIYANGAGIAGAGQAPGEATMAVYDSNGSFTNNLVIGANPAQYAGAHFANLSFAANTNTVGFTNQANGDYSLSSSSPYRGMANDGKDLGASFASSSTGSGLPTGWINIVSKVSGLCLADPASSQNPGTQMTQWTCNGYNDQKWQLTPVAGGYKITNQQSGLQLDIWGGPSYATNGAPLIQFPYWGGTNEIFQISKTADGYYTLSPTSDGSCLDVPYWSGSNWGKTLGLGIQQWSCWGGDGQKWSLVPVQ